MKRLFVTLEKVGLVLLLAGLVLTGCEGEQGPPGPQGPQGPEGPEGPQGPGAGGLAFLGSNDQTCGHCHAGTVGGWLGTRHANAWETLGADTANLFCVQCHVTGFDSEIDPNGNLVSAGPDTTGYDDNPHPALRDVQCEACHGPMGPIPPLHRPELEATLDGTACARCHPAFDEWATSDHATAVERAGGHEAFLEEWGHPPCQSCHVAEGFIMEKDPDHPGGTLPLERQIVCAACHDAHSAHNPAQLRTVADAFSPYSALSPTGYNITGLGRGQLCVQCHHARRTEANVMSQINNGTTRPGPHPSAEGDMVVGQGSYEIPGFTYDRGPLHPPSLMPDQCVDCHMIQRGSFTDPDPAFPFQGHTFRPEVSFCQTCHPGATDFNINGVQTQVHELLSELAMLLPPVGVDSVFATMDTLNWTRPQREAGYIYYFVEDDGTFGVHNRDYTISLLNAAIQYLQPGMAEN